MESKHIIKREVSSVDEHVKNHFDMLLQINPELEAAKEEGKNLSEDEVTPITSSLIIYDDEWEDETVKALIGDDILNKMRDIRKGKFKKKYHPHRDYTMVLAYKHQDLDVKDIYLQVTLVEKRPIKMTPENAE